jgi:hypothetical protein
MDYSKLKVTELKDLLKDRGIPSTGLSRKQSIIDALEAHDGAPVAVDEAGGKAVAADEAETGVEAEKVEAAIDALEASKEMADEGTTGAQDEANGDAEMEDAPPPAEHKTDQPAESENAVLATPQQSDLEREDASTDTRKRKRRSPTPPLSEESVNKKLKAAEVETVNPPEDIAIDDAPHSTTLEGAVHPTTRALYIRQIIRPLQPSQLRDHLVFLAGPDAADSVIETFHLDVLRTHAFAIFTSTEAAIRVRSALHERVFPDEPTRKALWVDFVPADRVLEWIELEMSSGTSRRDAKRWEVVYDDADGNMHVSLQEAAASHGPPGRQGSMTGQGGQGMSNAPSGPRESRPSETPHPTLPSPEQQREATRTLEHEPDDRMNEAPDNAAAGATTGSTSFNLLDDAFRSTTTKPKLYYRPQTDELAAQRLANLAGETSRTWDGGRQSDFEGQQQLRRYTFEDGDRLVDGGPDRGSFGVPGGIGGGRGRGRGGGYRGGLRR